MRFFQYAQNGETGLAIVSQDGALGLLESDPSYPGNLDSLVRAGGDSLARAAAALANGGAVDEASVRFLPPFSNPGKMICVGLNYAEHQQESGYAMPDYPTLFGRFNTSLIAHDEPMVRPLASDTLDWEGELVAVIGTVGRRIAPDAALSHVIGYTIFNDGSVREYQFKAPQWTMGKNFDGTGAIGPYFVTADELPAGAKGLRLETRVNGSVMQSASTSDMVFDVASLVTIISESLTFEPGDLIITGTPAGVGHAREPRIYLKAGDLCEVEIEQLGVLRNVVEDEVVADRAAA